MKNINIKILAILVGVLCMATNCENEDCHNKIPFVNNSNETLYVTSDIYYPFDTLLRVGSFEEHINKVSPHSVNTTCLTRRAKTCYDAFSKIMIFIIEEQVVMTTPPGIGSYYMILQRYDLTPEDLQILNWEVPYPPTEAMKNMKMYPPYEE